MSGHSVCPSAYRPLDFDQLMYNTEFYPIRCIDCGTIIAQYEHIKEDGMEWWGYRDTIARIDSADSLRCGKCYRKYARLE